VNAAVLTVSAWPELTDGADEPRGAIGDDQARCAKPAGREITPEIEPVFL
jgi:hypothetical protein